MPQPARSVARRNQGQKSIGVADAKSKVLGLIAEGMKVDDAMASVGRSGETYRDWRKNDKAFRDEVALLRSAQGISGEAKPPVPDFPQFLKELVGFDLYKHQQQIWDVIHGVDKPDLDPVMRYTRGVDWDPSRAPEVPGGRVIINAPPGFAKSTTFTVFWVLWLLYKNPNIRIIIVSKTQNSAKLQLGRIRHYLTSSVNREFLARYAPEGGWKDPDKSWTSTEIFVQGKGDGERDPSVQALGMGGQIYGSRADLIILDDTVTLANVNEHESQMNWLEQEVESRLDGRGMLLLLNTRVAPVDLFSELRKLTDADDNPVFTYLAMPALLDEGDGTPDTWVSLWPEGFPPSRLRKMRRREDRWALVYQQSDVAEDSTFHPRAVEASVNRQRFPGPMTEEGMGHRPGGMTGLYVTVGVDPAAAGNTAMIVTGLDKTTGKRWILDGYNKRNASAQQIKDTIKRLVETYHANELVVETNAFQRYLTQDAELVNFVRAKGCKMTPHNTNVNKHDADFGVMTMAPLFMTCGEPPSNGGGGMWRKTPDKALIELPATSQNSWVAELVNQLVIWQPSGMKQLQKSDLVMALWFTHIACQKLMDRGSRRPTHMPNPFLSRERSRSRQVINLADYRAAQEAEKEAG